MEERSKVTPAGAIGVFDSGVGGLSVVSHLQAQLPAEDLIYLADQVHVPYGRRPVREVRQFAEAMARFLLEQGAKALVVACNTASAAALNHLRLLFPGLPIVGMEPAVKPGTAHTRSGKVGVLATSGTFESERYARLMTRFAQDTEVLEDPCIGLVELIERTEVSGQETRQLLGAALQPMLDKGVDTVVLGCTHYPFVLPLIRQLAGHQVTIIDPAPAVARQTHRVLESAGMLKSETENGKVVAYTSGDPDQLAWQIERLLGQTWPVNYGRWHHSVV